MRRTRSQDAEKPKKAAKKTKDSSPKVREDSSDGEAVVASKYILKEPAAIECLALDPESCETVADFQAKFDEIATTLMNNYILDIKGKAHRLAELEFYLNDDNHKDAFTHGDEQQLTHGQWYFHKVGTGYKGGSYKGLDITFSKRGYGGILIRAVVNLENDEYLEGPCNVVDHILTLCRTEDGIPEISELVENEDFHWEVDVPGLLCIRPSEELERNLPVKSGRFGLVLRTDPGVEFCLKPYRYMLFPLEVRKGRQSLILHLHHDGRSAAEIRKLTGATASVISKYIAGYDRSKAKPKQASFYFAEKLNVEAFSEFYHVLASAADPKNQEEKTDK